MLKDRVNALVNAIHTKEADAEIKEMCMDNVNRMLNACNEYVKCVAECEQFMTLAYVRYDREEAQFRIVTMDNTRRVRHNDLMGLVNMLNRTCKRYGVEPLVEIDDTNRDDYGVFALEVVNTYFKEV